MSPATRSLTYVQLALYLGLGAAMFGAPAWASERFAWRVSPFVAMTIGAWCLGNAAYAWNAARSGSRQMGYAALLYLWSFAALQSLVLVAFRDRVVVDTVLSVPYLAVLAVGLIATVVGAIDWARADRATRRGPVGILTRVAIAGFFVLVGALGVLGGRAQQGGRSTEGGIFPEPLSLFSVRAFAAFFAALALSSLPLIFARSPEPVRLWLRSGIALIVPILIAAFVYRGAFEIDHRAGGLIYIGAYVLAFVVASILLWWQARQARG